MFNFKVQTSNPMARDFWIQKSWDSKASSEMHRPIRRSLMEPLEIQTIEEITWWYSLKRQTFRLIEYEPFECTDFFKFHCNDSSHWNPVESFSLLDQKLVLRELSKVCEERCSLACKWQLPCKEIARRFESKLLIRTTEVWRGTERLHSRAYNVETLVERANKSESQFKQRTHTTNGYEND